MDETLRSRLDIGDSFLAREDWRLVTTRGDWVEQLKQHQPELLVIAHDPARVDAVALIRELRRAEDQAVQQQRVICVLDEESYTRHYDILAGHSVACLLGRIDSEALLGAMTQLLNVPTRVNVRARVVFELQGRKQSDDLFHGRMLDVSTGGFFFESTDEFELDEMLYSFFSLGKDEPVIFASGRIARITSVPAGLKRYGVEFQDVRIEDRKRIADYIYRHCVDQVPYRSEGKELMAAAAS